jgi:hypothetical protein
MTLNEYTQTPEYAAAGVWSQKAAEAMASGGSLPDEHGRPIGAETIAWFASDAYSRLSPRP